MKKVLFVASEASPFIKTGGLADVAGSLPKMLKKAGVDIKVVIPNYSLIKNKYKKEMKDVSNSTVELGWRKQYMGIKTINKDGVDYYFIDNEYYFNRDTIYSNGDDGERFSYFNKAVLQLIKDIDFKPDIIHSNDWHTSLIGYLLNAYKEKDDFYKDIKSIFTIHNLKYQGIYSEDMFYDFFGKDMIDRNLDNIEFHNDVNFMKAGIVYADYVTTVSPSYSEEIKYSYYGERLEGVLSEKGDHLLGILNGIDCDVFSPEDDVHVLKNYNVDSIEIKKENKVLMQDLMGFPINKDIPLLSMVTRLVDMKGLDLLKHIFDELMQQNIQFVLLGTGKIEYENFFRHMENEYPKKFKANIFFDEELSSKIYASSDIFIMPSKFEPCGLGQLIALRYGTIPIVRQIGGLKDTIVPYNNKSEIGNGFGFLNYNAHELLYTIKDAINLYNNKSEWGKIVRNAMRTDTSWVTSANEYIKLYEKC
jgi:starch synthase